MGDSASNCTVRVHRSSTNPLLKETFIHLHYGSQSIDTISPASSNADWKLYRDAVLNNYSDTTIHDYGIQAWGTSWYTSNIINNAGFYAALKGAIFDGCAP
jgi:hypothetical protein